MRQILICVRTCRRQLLIYVETYIMICIKYKTNSDLGRMYILACVKYLICIFLFYKNKH